MQKKEYGDHIREAYFISLVLVATAWKHAGVLGSQGGTVWLTF